MAVTRQNNGRYTSRIWWHWEATDSDEGRQKCSRENESKLRTTREQEAKKRKHLKSMPYRKHL